MKQMSIYQAVLLFKLIIFMELFLNEKKGVDLGTRKKINLGFRYEFLAYPSRQIFGTITHIAPKI